MFNKNKLRAKFTECGYTMEKVAKIMGFSVVTLRKKMNQNGDFTRTEMLRLNSILKLTLTEFMEIFFGTQLAEK